MGDAEFPVKVGRRLARVCALMLAAACAGAPTPGSTDYDPELVDRLRRSLETEPLPPVEEQELEAATRPRPPTARRVWIDVEGRDGRTVDVPWLEVKGLAGAASGRAYDVVIVLDVSGSTQYASGADVNENGIVGVRKGPIRPWKVLPPNHYSSDPGDTVLDAERVATHRLIERLDPNYTRVALVAFSDLARMRAPLGSSRDLLGRVLDDLDGAFGAGPTNLARATRVATRILMEAAPRGGRATEKRILLLSDGEPTHPAPAKRAAAEALVAAREAQEAGIRLTTFALGADAPSGPDVFAEMAALTGGDHVRLSQPGDLVHLLPRVDLASVARVDVTNLSTGTAARAQRMRPDGRFDAFVKLEPGVNRLRFAAHGSAGGEARAEQTVVYDPSNTDPGSLSDVQRALQQRTLELSLEREMRAARQKRALELHGEAREGD
jgi:Mg-chelatase subunit ChlD